jgi:hypothetical protein
MAAARCTRPYNYLVMFPWLRFLVPLAVPVAVSAAPAAPATAAALSCAATATATALFRPIAALAVNRAVSAGFKRNCGRLSATGANHGSAGAHAAPATAITSVVLGMGLGWSMAAAPGSPLLGLAARFTASRRGVPAFLEKLLLTGGENKFLTAVVTRK